MQQRNGTLPGLAVLAQMSRGESLNRDTPEHDSFTHIADLVCRTGTTAHQEGHVGQGLPQRPPREAAATAVPAGARTNRALALQGRDEGTDWRLMR